MGYDEPRPLWHALVYSDAGGEPGSRRGHAVAECCEGGIVRAHLNSRCSPHCLLKHYSSSSAVIAELVALRRAQAC
jgi:hypothetical protein